MNRWTQWIGLGVLLAGAWGVWWLFTGMPVSEEVSETPVETVVPVQVGQIEVKTLHGYVQAYGAVVPDPGTGDRLPGSACVTSPLDSQITEVTCKIGQSVSQGQPLFRLYDRDAQLAEQEARQSLDAALQTLARQEKLMALESTSEKLLLEAKQQWAQAQSRFSQTQAALTLYEITAPSAGTITDIPVRSGQAVTRAQVLATLVNQDQLVIRTGVPSAQVGAVQPGQTVEIRVQDDAHAAESAMKGKVLYVDSQVDADNDTVMVLTQLPSQSGLRNGQFVSTRIVVAEHLDCLAVPVESVVTTVEGQTVVALVQGDEAVPTPVQPGLAEGAWIEITGQGLVKDMPVVTRGAYGLPGRTRIRVIGQ
ncbi:MAG: efflux RND transporter periplasmic adaptor subunit [Phycisphaerae bacterium]|nr:efflux RND transporter periplasmic adaptor subunit [Phycisphaerae bacterium]